MATEEELATTVSIVPTEAEGHDTDKTSTPTVQTETRPKLLMDFVLETYESAVREVPKPARNEEMKIWTITTMMEYIFTGRVVIEGCKNEIESFTDMVKAVKTQLYLEHVNVTVPDPVAETPKPVEKVSLGLDCVDSLTVAREINMSDAERIALNAHLSANSVKKAAKFHLTLQALSLSMGQREFTDSNLKAVLEALGDEIYKQLKPEWIRYAVVAARLLPEKDTEDLDAQVAYEIKRIESFWDTVDEAEKASLFHI